MKLQRNYQETHFPEVRLLESRTPGVPFRMNGSVRWMSGKASHPRLEALVRDVTTSRAQAIAVRRYADDVYGAEDAINADLGSGNVEDTLYYSGLTAIVALDVPDQEDMANSRNYRDSLARVERLRFLKDQLYSDPSMLLLDYIDRNPGKLDEVPDLAGFQRLALKISGGERWWCQVLDVLERLSSEVSDERGNLWAMTLLLGALKEAAPDLFSNVQKESDVSHTDFHGQGRNGLTVVPNEGR
jgi:hypothetical protein